MTKKPLKIAVLGSTGSLGQTILSVIDSINEDVQIVGLGTGSNIDLLEKQVEKYNPKMVSIAHGRWQKESKNLTVVTAKDLVTSPDIDLVFIANVGRSSLRATWEAVKSGKDVALGNIGCLFIMGDLLKQTAKETGSTIFPLDDEPAGVWQTLWGEDVNKVDQVTITSTWGTLNSKKLRNHGLKAMVRPSRKVSQRRSIDSSTLITKATQVSAIHYLYDVPLDKIRVLYHPESVVRALTEFHDGSVKAVLSNPDMRVPVQLALAYPERWSNKSVNRVNLLDIGQVSFQPLEKETFSCYEIALSAVRQGFTYPAVASAANEAAVDLFLSQQIGFTEIQGLIDMAMANHIPQKTTTIDDILVADEWARSFVGSQVPD